jgi:hypothetical protein
MKSRSMSAARRSRVWPVASTRMSTIRRRILHHLGHRNLRDRRFAPARRRAADARARVRWVVHSACPSRRRPAVRRRRMLPGRRRIVDTSGAM